MSGWHFRYRGGRSWWGSAAESASVSLVWGLWKYVPWPRSVSEAYPVPACCSYVDYAGWLLTKTDKDRLTASGRIRLLESMSLEGRDFADEVVANADACSTWCLAEPDCQGFTYGKPSHPDPHSQNRCWLKATSQLTPLADPKFTSGLR